MMGSPPGGLPSWLQALPTNLTIPFNAIQQTIRDFVTGIQPSSAEVPARLDPQTRLMAGEQGPQREETPAKPFSRGYGELQPPPIQTALGTVGNFFNELDKLQGMTIPSAIRALGDVASWSEERVGDVQQAMGEGARDSLVAEEWPQLRRFDPALLGEQMGQKERGRALQARHRDIEQDTSEELVTELDRTVGASLNAPTRVRALQHIAALTGAMDAEAERFIAEEVDADAVLASGLTSEGFIDQHLEEWLATGMQAITDHFGDPKKQILVEGVGDPLNVIDLFDPFGGPLPVLATLKRLGSRGAAKAGVRKNLLTAARKTVDKRRSAKSSLDDEPSFEELNEEYNWGQHFSEGSGPGQGDGGSFFEPPEGGPPGGPFDPEPLWELEGEWRDPRALPSFMIDDIEMGRLGGSYDPYIGRVDQTDEQREMLENILNRNLLGEELTPIAGLIPLPPAVGDTVGGLDSGVGNTVHVDTTLDSPLTPGELLGDPTQVLTPGTAQWRERQAFDRRDELINRAYALNQNWGLDLRDALISIEDEVNEMERLGRETFRDPAAPPSMQSFVDRFAQVPTTERQQTINDQWEKVIKQADIKAQKDAYDELEALDADLWFTDGGFEKSIDYLEDRYPDIDFEDLRPRLSDPAHPLHDQRMPDKLRLLSRYVDEYYKNGGNFQEDLRAITAKRGDTDWFWAGSDEPVWLKEGLDELKASGASDFQVMVIHDYIDGIKEMLPKDASLGEHGQIIPGETPVDQILLDLHEEIMNEYNEFS